MEDGIRRILCTKALTVSQHRTHYIPRLLGIPFDESSSFMRGPAKAPPIIRRALFSASSNMFSESVRDLGTTDHFGDAGDLVLSGKDPRAEIEAGVRNLLDGLTAPLLLGGDHSITYPILRAFASASKSPLTVLHVDAHADLYDEFQGTRFSHACPFARIMEEGLASRLVQVGIRTLNTHQQEQAEKFGVEIVDMKAWCAGARPAVSGDVYLSFDMDALDPSFAPGVSHWEPGGLSVREALEIIQTTGGRLIGADVVEYNPDRDATGVTAYVAAKLVKEIADRMLSVR